MISISKRINILNPFIQTNVDSGEPINHEERVLKFTCMHIDHILMKLQYLLKPDNRHLCRVYFASAVRVEHNILTNQFKKLRRISLQQRIHKLFNLILCNGNRRLLVRVEMDAFFCAVENLPAIRTAFPYYIGNLFERIIKNLSK